MPHLDPAETVLLLLLPVAGLTLLAERWRVPYPILLVLGGLVLGLIPGPPQLRLNPGIILLFIVPPLLYVAAFNTPVHELRRNVRPIGLLSVGLVFFTTALVAWAAHAVVPDLTWPAAFALGAIVSPTDAIAAAATFQRLGVPRRISSILQGESLVNDASALIVYRFAVIAAATGKFSPATAGWEFLKLLVGGVIFGFGVGRVAAWARARVAAPAINATFSLITPFAAYLPAEKLGVSSVLAVVTAGLVVGWHAPTDVDSDARLPTKAVWQIVDYLLNGVVFILIGLQLPWILRDLSAYSWSQLLLYGAGLSLLVVLVRIGWVFPFAYLPWTLAPQRREPDFASSWHYPAVISWAGLRGVISLAIAFGLPGGFPGRELIIFLTFCVILATLVVQGLSLPWLIRWLGLEDDGLSGREEALARLRASNAALAAIERAGSGKEPPAPRVQEILRLIYRRQREDAQQLQAVADPDDEKTTVTGEEQRQGVFALRRVALDAERRVILGMRRKGELHDDVLRNLEHELDVEEQRVRRPR